MTKYIEVSVQDLSDPETLKKISAMETPEKNEVYVILFKDYLKVLRHLEPHHRPSTELMFLTGMIPSEISALRKEDIDNNVIRVRWSMTRGNLKNKGKTKFRHRDIPITRSILRVLNEALEQNGFPFIFTSKTGGLFNEKVHRDEWKKACALAGVKYIRPYCSRHSYVAYSQQLKVNKYLLIELIGHRDKSLIDNVYGRHIDGLGKDLKAIKEYYGQDYWGQ